MLHIPPLLAVVAVKAAKAYAIRQGMKKAGEAWQKRT
jgi:hypothetical protein